MKGLCFLRTAPGSLSTQTASSFWIAMAEDSWCQDRGRQNPWRCVIESPCDKSLYRAAKAGFDLCSSTALVQEFAMNTQALGYLGIRTKDLGDWSSYGSGLLGLQRIDRSRSSIAFRMDDRKQRIIVDEDGGAGI